MRKALHKYFRYLWKWHINITCTYLVYDNYKGKGSVLEKERDSLRDVNIVSASFSLLLSVISSSSTATATAAATHHHFLFFFEKNGSFVSFSRPVLGRLWGEDSLSVHRRGLGCGVSVSLNHIKCIVFPSITVFLHYRNTIHSQSKWLLFQMDLLFTE